MCCPDIPDEALLDGPETIPENIPDKALETIPEDISKNRLEDNLEDDVIDWPGNIPDEALMELDAPENNQEEIQDRMMEANSVCHDDDTNVEELFSLSNKVSKVSSYALQPNQIV